MSKKTIEHQFLNKWRNAEELPIPSDVDEKIESSLQQAFKDRVNKETQPLEVKGVKWLSAIAASLLVVFLSWNYLAKENVSNADKLLLTAIEQSNKLDGEFSQLQNKEFSQHVYIQKFQLETELELINNRLADAYLENNNLQKKLQLWHQRNRTLSQLTDLMTNDANQRVTQI